MVKCSECGFLALRSNSTGQHIEANDEFRGTGRPHPQLGAFSYPLCFQNVIDLPQLAMALPDSVRGRDKRVLEIIRSERPCGRYAAWRIGYGPREHLEMNPGDFQMAKESEIDAREGAIGVFLTGEQPATTGSLQALYMPGPNSMARPHFVDFTTEGRDAVAINTRGPFQALRFVKPVEKIVHATDLPVEIPGGSGKLIIKRFNNDSFAIEEHDTDGDQVGVEIYPSSAPSLEPANQERTLAMSEVDPTKVFVVHGRNEHIRSGMFSFLRAIGLDPIEWTKAIEMTGKGSPYVGEILDAALANAQAIVVVMTPDDEAKLRDQYLTGQDQEYERSLTPQARPNVLFEAGLALGRSPDQTILVEIGELRPFSDIAGRHTIRLDNSPERRLALANRLKTAGCEVDTAAGADWLTQGDFSLETTSSPTSTTLDPANQSSVNLNNLGQLFGQGDDLFQRRITDEQSYEQWILDTSKWLRQVTEELEANFTEADKQLFVRIQDQMGTKYGRYGQAYNQEHDGKLWALKTHQENLRRILDRGG